MPPKETKPNEIAIGKRNNKRATSTAMHMRPIVSNAIYSVSGCASIYFEMGRSGEPVKTAKKR